MDRERLEKPNLIGQIKFLISHVNRSLTRSKFHFLLAFLSCFIAVLSTLVINTVIEKGPIIFLRIAEANHGEIDGVVYPYGRKASKPLIHDESQV
jgi:hypothetical protein